MTVPDDRQLSSTGSNSSSSEFLRWILILSALVIAEGSALESFLGNWPIAAVYVCIWAPNALAEAWIQFSGWARRLAWTTAGVLTGLCLAPFDADSGVACLYVMGLLIVPALLEFRTAKGVRRKSWVWLLVTPLGYALWKLFSEFGIDLADSIMEWLVKLSGMGLPLSSRIPAFAFVLGILFFSRAMIGSFFASRRDASNKVATIGDHPPDPRSA